MGMPSWVIVLAAVILLISLAFNLLAVAVVRQRDRDYDRILGSNDATGARLKEAVAALEKIRDMGPKGPDPLPPCRFCGQGPGHWIDPKDMTCPAVLARKAIFDLNRPAG